MRLDENGNGETLISLADTLAESGVSKLVLHAWERRYGFKPANRSASGRRFYTVSQVQRLRQLKTCSDAGHRIGALIALSPESLQKIHEEVTATRGMIEIIEAAQALDGETLLAKLQARAETQDPETFIRRTALPLMREVGARWESGTLSIAAEHMATAQIKRILGGMFDRCAAPHPDAPRLIATTPEREEHDTGALVITLIARLRGWNALFLGSSLPVVEVAEAAHRRQVRVVCLSALTGRGQVLERHLLDLRSKLSAGIDIWIGGFAYMSLPPIAGTCYFADLDTFSAALLTETERLPLAM
jgi:MerR family transcriptional regulator, light-induced transcriptional regulator